MSTAHIPSRQRLVLHGVTWRTYLRMLRAFDERPGIRFTYDRGALEIMTLTYGHESRAHLLGRFVLVLTEELGLPVAGGGSTTFRRRRQRRGLEPDECYWVASEPLVRGRDRIDLRRDPPPDLALEVDITHSSLDRMAIYAALGLPEIWRFDAGAISFHVLGEDASYAASERSRVFPQVSPADLDRFLALRGQTDENSVIRQFRAWVRQHHGLDTQGPQSP